MRTRILILMLALLLAGTTTALATNDLVGLFFDLDAQSQCLDVSDLNPGADLDIYLILQNASQPAVYGFDAGIQFQQELILFMSQTFPVTALGNGMPFDQYVGYAVPLPTTAATVLVTFHVSYIGLDQEGVCLQLTGSSISSLNPLYPTLYYGDGQQVMGNVVSGPYGAQCTAVIGDCTVGSETHAFGAMKALYR